MDFYLGKPKYMKSVKLQLLVTFDKDSIEASTLYETIGNEKGISSKQLEDFGKALKDFDAFKKNLFACHYEPNAS